MKLKLILAICAILTAQFGYGQTADETGDYIILAKTLSLYGNSPELRGFQREMNLVTSPSLEQTKEFINALVSRKQLLSNNFLEKQDSLELRRRYVVAELSQYIGAADPSQHLTMARQVMLKDVPLQELAVTYYSILFRAAVKQPLMEYAKKKRIDFEELNLRTAQEKAIVFLAAMTAYNQVVIRAIHVDEPRDFDRANYWLSIFPQIEGLPAYYYYKDFDFKDFKIKLGGQYKSYKAYYLTQYYELLLSHVLACSEKKGKEAEIADLKNNSILFEKKFYNLLEKGTRDVLQGLNGENENTKGDLAAANKAFETNDLETAIRLYEQELAKTSDLPKVQEKLALAYLKNGRLDDAYEMYLSYSKSVPASPTGFYGMARSQHAKGELDSALRNAKKALTRFEELEPAKLPSSWALLGMIYFDMGDSKVAKSYLKKADKEGGIIPEKYTKALGVK